jgi:four helix bundle protein
MGQIDIYERVFEFACRVVRMDRALSRSRTVNRNAMRQLVRAATSVGANLEEAKAGQNRADFHAKLRIALKEARESHYWLRLIAATGDARIRERVSPLAEEANSLVAILTTISKKASQPLLSTP